MNIRIVGDLGRCRFCRDDAVVKVRMDRGCVCYPDDREQCLCMQHYIRATPLGTFEVIESLPALDEI